MDKKSKKIVYVAMPKMLGGREKNVVNLAKKKLILKYPVYKNHSFFNPFVEIDQNRSENEIMDQCFKVVGKSKAVLHILPLPPEIDSTVTVGAISESDFALKKNKPVFICTFEEKPVDIFRVDHIDELMNKLNLKVPYWWFRVAWNRGLNISKKFRDTE